MIRGRGVARAQAHGTQFNLTLLFPFAFFHGSLTELDTHLLRTASCSVARFTHIAEHKRNGERNWMRPAVVCIYPGTTRSLRSKATFSITVGRWPYTNVHRPFNIGDSDFPAYRTHYYLTRHWNAIDAVQLHWREMARVIHTDERFSLSSCDAGILAGVTSRNLLFIQWLGVGGSRI